MFTGEAVWFGGCCRQHHAWGNTFCQVLPSACWRLKCPSTNQLAVCTGEQDINGMCHQCFLILNIIMEKTGRTRGFPVPKFLALTWHNLFQCHGFNVPRWQLRGRPKRWTCSWETCMLGACKGVHGAIFPSFSISFSWEAVLLHVWCSWPTAWEALSNPTLHWACLRSSVWQDRWVSCPLLCPLSCLSHLIMGRNVVCAAEHREFVSVPCVPQPFNLKRERGSRE